jgi:N-acetylneuraminic acid mutarotase
MKTTHPFLHWIMVAAALSIFAFGLAQGNHYILPCADECLTPGTWSVTGNLNTARTGHTATLLSDGTVLVAGGVTDQENGDVLDSAELYDPRTGLWSFTASMSRPRGGHTATLLQDGRVLVAGGVSNQMIVGTAEIYDPLSGTWSTTADMMVVRSGHTATLLQDGNVLVAAGFGGDEPSNAAELFDPATNAWHSTGNLNWSRYWHTATLLQNGKVLVARGSNDDGLGSTLSVPELYDPSSGTWAVVASLNGSSVFRNASSIDHTATLLPNGSVLVAGGYGGAVVPLEGYASGAGVGQTLAKSELFDPASETWSTVGSLAVPRYSHTATLLATGDVLIAGGVTATGHYLATQYEVLDQSEVFDTGAALWSNQGNLNFARLGHTATLLPNGTVLVVGGSVIGPNYSTSVLDSAELFTSEAYH